MCHTPEVFIGKVRMGAAIKTYLSDCRACRRYKEDVIPL